jgi:hypothetical protein
MIRRRRTLVVEVPGHLQELGLISRRTCAQRRRGSVRVFRIHLAQLPQLNSLWRRPVLSC